MDDITTGVFDDPQEMPKVDLSGVATEFKNPFDTVLQERPFNYRGGAFSSPNADPLGGQFDRVLRKGASFEAATAPKFFDWEGTNADRYTNSSYYKELGFNPDRDNETLFGNRQTWGDVMSNAFAGAGELAWNTFVDGWAGWGRMVKALGSWDASKLMGSPEELAELDREQKRIMDKYAIFKTPESEEGLFNRQFFGDMVQQSGFALGTLAQFATEELLTMGATTFLKSVTGARFLAGVGRGVGIGEVTADMKRIGDVAWKGETASKLFNGLKFMGKYTPVAGNLVDTGRALYETAKEGGGFLKTLKGGGVWELGGITFNGLRRTMAEANMAFTESRMEAAGTYAELKERLTQDHIMSGRDLTPTDEEHIESMAQDGAMSNFKTNAIVISVMNRMQFDNLFRKFGADKRAVRELVEGGEDVGEKIMKVSGKSARDVVGEGGEIGIKAGERLTKVYEKGALGTFRNVRKIAGDFGKRRAAWEATKSVGKNLFKWEVSEGIQELIQEGSNIAIKDYYSDLYLTGKGDRWDSVGNAMDELEDINGLKTFLMGAVTGRLMSPLNSAFEYVGERYSTNKADREAAVSDRGKAISAVNSFFADPSRFAPEAIANLRAQNRTAEKMEQALADNDRYIYEHAKDSSFAKSVSAAKKLNMLESLTDTIRAYGDHFDEKQFSEAFAGMDFKDEKDRNTVKEYMNRVANEVEAFSARYDKLKETYSDVVKPERYTGAMRDKAASVRRALDEAVEWIATNEYRAGRSAARGLSILQTASELPTIGQTAHIAFRLLGDDSALRGEIGLLDQEIGAMESAETKDEVVNQQLELKRAQRDALKKLKGNVSLFEEDRETLEGRVAYEKEKEGNKVIFEENKINNLMDGLRDYINAKNKENGNNTKVTPNDLEDVYFQLRDYRRLQDDEKNFMDAYALLANRKNFLGVVMRIREGLDYVEGEQKKKGTGTPSGTTETSAKVNVNGGDSEEEEQAAKVGSVVDDYHDFKVGDMITYEDKGKEQGPFEVERVSTTRVELLNSKTNVKEQVSLDRFDELVAGNKLKRVSREEKFGADLAKGKTLIDGKDGVYMVKIVQDGSTYYVLTDSKEHVLNEAGELMDGSETPITYEGEDEGVAEAGEARDKILLLRKNRDEEKKAVYSFDGKELKWGDILIKEGERYRVMTAKEPELEEGKPMITVQLLGGKDGVRIESLAGYELAREVAGARTKTREEEKRSAKFKLKVDEVLTAVRGVVKEGATQEDADKVFGEFIRSVTREDLLKHLMVRVTRNAAWKPKQEYVHAENEHLIVNGSDLNVELLYKNEVVGLLPFYRSYAFQGTDGKKVELSNLTREQFEQLFDVSGVDVGEAVKKVRKDYNTAKEIFDEIYLKILNKDVVELGEKEIRKLFEIKLFTGDYDWVAKPSVALKDLRYNSVGGNVVLLARRLGLGSKDKHGLAERIVSEKAMSDDERQALLKRVSENRRSSGEGSTDGMGNYVAVVELPNKELRFVPLLLPAYDVKELDELVKELNEQSKVTKERNLVEDKKKIVAKDSSFNTVFNEQIAKRLMVSVDSGLEVSVGLDGVGNLEVVFFDIGKNYTSVVRLEGKDRKSPVAYTSFSEMLDAINKKIKAQDAKQPNVLQRIDVRLEASDFKKHLSDDPDFTVINNFLTPVSREVVRGGYVNFTFDSDVKRVFDVRLPDTKVPGVLRRGGKPVEAGVINKGKAAFATVQPAGMAAGRKEIPETGANERRLEKGAGSAPVSGMTDQKSGVTDQKSGAKVDQLKELTDTKLPALKASVLNGYIKSGLSTKEAKQATDKDEKVVELVADIKRLEEDINREKKAYKAVTSSILSQGGVEQIGRFREWVNTKLPKFITVQESNLIRDNMLKEGITVGQFVYSLKTLSEAKKGTIVVDRAAPFKYHEAFHAVFRLLLSDMQIEKYLGIAKKEVKEVLAKKKTTLQKELKEMRELTPEYYEGLSEEEMEQRYYEEYLADRFDAWKMDYSVKTNASNKNLFRRILDWITNVYKRFTAGELESLFYEVNAGKFRDASLAVNQFTSDEGVKGNVQVIPKAIKIGERWVKDEDGNAVRINEYLPEEKGSALAAAIAATFHDRMERGGKDVIADTVMNEIFDDYARLYDADNGQYLRYLESEDTQEQYFRMEGELNKLKELFTTGRGVLKEAVEKHFQSIAYLQSEAADEDEDMVDERGDRAGQDYKKSKESFGGFGSLPKWLRHYIATTTYEGVDAYENAYLKDGERLLQGVDANRVYSGVLKAVAGFDDVHKMLLRMREFGRYNEQSGYFIERFFDDMGVAVTDNSYTLSKEKMKHKFMMVMKSFQQYTPDYLLISKNLGKGETIINKANRRAAAGNQFSIWYNAYSERFEKIYLQLADGKRKAFLNDRVSGLRLFSKLANKKAIDDAKWEAGAERISNELKRKLGLSLHPSFIKYSLACMRSRKNQTRAQEALVNAFSDVTSMKPWDAEEIIGSIELGRNPFAWDRDIRSVEKRVSAKEGEDGREEIPYGNDRSNMGNDGRWEEREGADVEEGRSILMELAGSNAIFDETVNTTSFRNAEGELVYAHQLPTYHLVKVKELAGLLAKGAPVNEVLSELMNDPFMADHFLMNSDDFRVMASDMSVNRIEGMSSYYPRPEGRGKIRERGVTYGKFTEREMLVSLFELYGVNKKYEGASGNFYSSRHLVRVIEATNTGDTVNLPVIKAVESFPFEGTRLSGVGLDALVGEVRREFERIGRVKQEIGQIEDERLAYERDGTARRIKEIDDYHNVSGLSGASAKPRGLTLFKTGSMLGGMVEELEREAQGELPDFSRYEKRIEGQLQEHWMGDNGKVNKCIKLLLDKSIIRRPKDKNVGGFENVLLPGYMVDGFVNVYEGRPNDAKNEAMNVLPGNLEHNIAQVMINDFINTGSFNQLLLGDQATSLKDYVDMVKRAKGANGSGRSIAFDIIVPLLGIFHAGRKSHIIQIDDPKFFGKYAGKMKDKADAQMWMTVKSIRYTLFGLGKLTPRLASVLDKIEAGERLDVEEVFGKNGTLSYDGQTNSIKMVYYDRGRYIKTSGFVLTKELTSYKDLKGDWKARKGFEELHALREKLEDYERRNDTFCMAVPKSASKGEKANTARGILPVRRVMGDGREELVSPITDWNFQELDNRYWRLQTENPSNKIVITDPTQAKQLIMTEQDDELDVEFMWDKDGVPVATNMKVGALKKLYREQTAQRLKVKYRQARNELFDLEGTLEEISASIKAGEVTSKLAKFQERAIEVLRRTGADSQLLEFFTLDDNGDAKYDLNHPVTLDKFTQLFMAYFSKEVMNEKIPGRSITLVSSYGARVVKEVLDVDANGEPKRWRVVRRVEYEENPSLYEDAMEWEADGTERHVDDEARRKNAREYRLFRSLGERFEADKKAGRKTYILDDLRHDVAEYKLDEKGNIMKDGDGNDIILDRYAEFMMAAHSAEEMRLMEEGGELPEVLSKGFGVRIPTQAPHSHTNLRLVDFLPAYYGSSGMFAPELIEVSGADFDLDRLYEHVKEYYTRRKEGKTEFVEYGKTEDAGEQYDEFVLYQKRSNKRFKGRYRELLSEHPSYNELRERMLALRRVIKPFKEAVMRGRDSADSKKSAFWTRHSVNVLFDEIFGMDLVGEETRSDLGTLMKGLDRMAILDELKAIEDEGAVNLKEWSDHYTYLWGLLKDIDDGVTKKVLREFGMPGNVDDYAKKVSEEGEQHIGKLNNLILDAKMKLQGNEHMVKWNGTKPPIAYEVASVEPLENVLKYLKETFPMLADVLEEGNEDADSFLGKVAAYRNNKEGAENIGPAVNAMLGFTLLNTFKVGLRERQGDKKDRKGNDLWRFRLNAKTFDSYEHKNAYDFETKAYDGDRILHNISAIVSAMTDNAKERLAAKLGLNVEAVGLVSNLVAQGVPMQSAISFIMQPVIQEYYRRTNNLKAGLKTEEEEGVGPYAVGEEMKHEMKVKLGKGLKEVELTDELLKDGIVSGVKDSNEAYSVFISFLALKEQTKYFNAVSGIMKLAKGMGTSHEDVMKVEEKIDTLKLREEGAGFDNSNVPFDVRQIMLGKDKDAEHHEIMAAYLDIFDEINGLSKVMFLEQTDEFKQIAEVVKGNLRIRKFDTERFHKRFKRDLISYLSIKGYQQFLKDKGLMMRSMSLNNGMIHDADAMKLPDGFMDVVDVVRAIRDRLPDNYFANQFLNVLPTTVTLGSGQVVGNPFNAGGINKVEVNTWAKLNELQIEKLQSSFLDIYQHDDTRAYAWALFNYLHVKDGGQFRSGSFIRYVPNFMFKDISGVTSRINELMVKGKDEELYKEVFGVGSEELMNEFVRGYLLNVNNREYIASVDLTTARPEKIEILPFDTEEEIEQKRGNEYVPKTVLFHKDGTLEIDLERGVRAEKPVTGALKVGDVVDKGNEVYTKLSEKEQARKAENMSDLNSRGFWKGTRSVPQKKGSPWEVSGIRFPYVIRSIDDGKEVYYVLAAVDGKKQDLKKPTTFIEEDNGVAIGKRARYVRVNGLEGSVGQWSGAFVFGDMAPRLDDLRERTAVLNNGGFSLEEVLPLSAVEENSLAKEEELYEAYDVVYDFEDRYDVKVRYEKDKGLVFERDGKGVLNQGEMKRKYFEFGENYSKRMREMRLSEENRVDGDIMDKVATEDYVDGEGADASAEVPGPPPFSKAASPALENVPSLAGGEFEGGELAGGELGGSNANKLINFLRDRFPQLNITYVSENKARGLLKEREQQLEADARGKLDFEKVNSFVYKGTVYLISGRVTDQVAIEEVMHPFVYTLWKNNTELFERLRDAAVKEFPELRKSIESKYSAGLGFTEEDREQELVTQALAKTFAKEYEEKPPRSILKLLEELKEWFAKLLERFGAFMSGERMTIDVAKLPSDITLTGIAQLLNTYDSSFLVDTSSPRFNFSLSEEEQEFLRRLLKEANPLQKEIIEDLYRISNKVNLDKDTHIYYGDDEEGKGRGRVYTSMTAAIGGKFEDEEGWYQLNLLFGNDFDKIMEGLVFEKSFDEIKSTLKIDTGIARDAYREMRQFIYGLKANGSVLIPQLKLSDETSGIAGMMDLLLIDTDGRMMIIDLKTSKDSTRTPEYSTKTYETREGTLLPGEHLSKGQRHGIQVGGYNKLMGVNGYYPEDTITYHFWLDIKGERADQKLKGFTPEGSIPHSIAANKQYIDKIIPTREGEDKVRKYQRKLGMLSGGMEFDSKAWSEEFRDSEDFQQTFEAMTEGMEEFKDKARKRMDRLEMVKNTASFDSTKESVHKLSELLMIIGQDLSRGQADRAFGAFLNHARSELRGLIDYMGDTTNHGTDEYIRRVLDAGSYIETYRGMMNAPEWTLGNKHQNAMFDDVLKLLNVARRDVRSSLENYILDMMQNNSTREISEDHWRVLIKEGTDISSTDYHLGDIDTSSDPLIAVAAKLYKRAAMTSNDRSLRFEERLVELGNKLSRAFGGKPDYKWMVETDEKGKLTGRYVQEIGAQFWKLYKEKKAKVMDNEGKMMEYRKVYAGRGTKNAEDIAYNKKLMEVKKEWREFQQAEIQHEGGVSDGNYYRYTKEFKAEREKYEEYKPVILDGKFLRGEWVKRRDDDDKVGYEEYRAYQLKYYNFVEKFDMPYYENGEFTGELSGGRGSGRFVKNDYVEIRTVAGDETDMRSKQWLKLQNATNERERAMKEFYDFYIKEMEVSLEMLPLSTQKEMLGKLPRVRGNFVNHIEKSASLFTAAAKRVGSWFNVQTVAKESLYNEDGTPMNSIPVFYKGNLRDEGLIEQLKKKQDELEEDWKNKKIAKKDYLKEKDRLRNELRIALSAVSAEELETDMVKSLKEFRSKAESFKAMHDIEASLLAVQEMLAARRYRRKLVTGEDQLEKGTGRARLISGENSRTLERFKEWMQMSFYGSDDIDMGKGDVIAKRMMNLSSIVNVGFNAFGAVHNYAMARINTAIETWGGRFYDKSAGFRAVRVFNTDYLPGLFKAAGNNEDGFYKVKRAGSKYGAMVEFFNITRKQQSGEGRPEGLSSFLTYGYKASEAGEYAAQSKSGIAYLMTKTLQQVDGAGKEIAGTEVSVYDAFDFDEKTGTIKLKDGYVLTDDKKHDFTNGIWEMNKQMHGSYAPEDKMVIQKYTLGQMAVQFHKWVYPMYKARFKARYYDENLGDMEGRYLTVWKFMKFLYEAEGSLRERAYSAWKGMEKDQVQNLYRNAAELSFMLLSGATYMVLRGVSEGLDDDDDRLKRWVNFLRWENSRQIQEVKFWIPGVGISDQVEMIKNPFAMGTTFTRFASVLGEAADVAWPFNDSEIYYDKGPFKGELKLGKKVRDLLPVTKEINKWSSFSQVSDFFIK